MATIEGITHRTIKVNGIDMHVAEKGEGPVVLLVHGFPQLWYTWRHQINALAARGFRAVAPDMRGYGDTESPPSPDDYTIFTVVGDLIGLIEALGQKQVFVVGHDWGAAIAWHLCLFRPDAVKALVNLSIVFAPRNPKAKPVPSLRYAYGEDYYMVRVQQEGAEKKLEEAGAERVLRKFIAALTPDAPLMFSVFEDTSGELAALPPFLTEEDIQYYASKYEKSGFQGPLNYFRALDRNWELTAPYTGAKINVPTKFIIGDRDPSYHGPGTKQYVHSGGFNNFVPQLDDVVVMNGVGHFINEEKPDEVNEIIIDFFQKF